MAGKLPTTFVVDASILFSFFNSGSKRRKLIEELPNLGILLITPEHAFEELLSDKERIIKYGKINEPAFIFLLTLLEKKVELFPEDKYNKHIKEAHLLSPHQESPKDDPYFALALALNCAIWSDEKAFKKQSKIKVLTTQELIELLL